MGVASHMGLNVRKGNHYFPMQQGDALVKDYAQLKNLFGMRPGRWTFIAMEEGEIGRGMVAMNKRDELTEKKKYLSNNNKHPRCT